MKTTLNNIEQRILYEDNHIICIDKFPSDIVQGDKTGDVPLSDIVKQYLKIKYNKKGEAFLGIVHRIDRPTRGIVIFAKTSKALERLNKLFKDREIEKTYLAVVDKKEISKKGTLTHFLLRKERLNKSFAYDKEIENSKKAILHYEVYKKLNNYLILKINLETGRHHQIRCQLSKIGFPVKGDVKYGARRANKDKSISLCAWNVKFIHPIKKEEISITSKVDDDNIF